MRSGNDVRQDRWGPDAPLTDEAARERLLDAAEACFDRFGVAKTTIEDIAREAKVSRRTVYRYFAGRDELIVDVLLRETQSLFDGWNRYGESEPRPSFADMVVETMLQVLEVVRESGYVKVFLDAESAALTVVTAGASRSFFERVKQVVRPFFEEAEGSGELRPELDLDDLVEWLLRILLSLLTIRSPMPRSEDDYRRLLHTYLIPALVTPPARPKERP